MNRFDHEIAVGATEALSLRVSVATLVRVSFIDPHTGKTMLALERTATLRKNNGQSEIAVKAKPFGGAVQIIDAVELRNLIGNFQYDSERSRQEKDFRIQIHPSSWEKVKEICREHLDGKKPAILDSSPERELAEEFEDALKVKITRDQYQLKQLGIRIEDTPRETDNVRAAGRLTARVYYIFEARIDNPEIIALIAADALRYSDEDLQKIAHADALQGGQGRANALLTVGMDELKQMRTAAGLDKYNETIQIAGHQLSGNVIAILKEDEFSG
jgi:hypothetical protein